LIGWFVCWLVGWVVGWLVDWLVCLLAGWLIGWLIGWVVGLLVDWLVGWVGMHIVILPNVKSRLWLGGTIPGIGGYYYTTHFATLYESSYRGGGLRLSPFSFSASFTSLHVSVLRGCETCNTSTAAWRVGMRVQRAADGLTGIPDRFFRINQTESLAKQHRRP